MEKDFTESLERFNEEGKPIKVLLEMRSPDESMALESASSINVTGFELDKSYRVPVSPPTEGGAGLESVGERTVILRGTVDSREKIEELKRQPGVARVLVDSKIAPFSCPIPPCDCDPRTPKGTIDDVVHYLEVNKIWEEGYKR